MKNAIQRIFEEHGDEYIRRHGQRMPRQHLKAISAIRRCRTGDCGWHLFACPQCNDKRVALSSCGNRHCPQCQNDKSAMWVYRQQLRLLPCTYFLATFTLPQEVREVARSNQKAVYTAMFAEASASLRTLEADKRFVGCNVAGFFGVLHTWGRRMQYHPHIHFVVPGGGLSEDRDEWVSATGDFLVHVRALSRMFRGRMEKVFTRLGLHESVPPEVWRKEWVVHCQSVGDGRATMKYLGAYVFRTAISNSRIADYDGETVTVKYRKVGSSRWRRTTFGAFEFMRRYLQHVLPHGFMKVRHYGFLSPNFAVPLQKIRELICILYENLRDRPVKAEPPQKKPPLCDKCGTGMRWLKFFPPSRLAGMPPP